ncbi:MAG: hypothetical protein EOM20_11810 [Spartobacteria bacterium]|nr:hypothetical protein [Spartobacteria bacterium]
MKYRVPIQPTPPRFVPVAPLNVMEIEGCLGCLECVKRLSCVYDVYQQRVFDPLSFSDTADNLCIRCMRCVQECKKNILSRIRNPDYDGMGNDYWTPEIITAVMDQAATGAIPVSGAGYRGRFAGFGFDGMWTDMSEIIRPTRDGIHGREYISTVIELGHRPLFLSFDEQGRVRTPALRLREIPIPILLEPPENSFVTPAVTEAVMDAASRLGTYAFVSKAVWEALDPTFRARAVVVCDRIPDIPASVSLASVPYADSVADALDLLRKTRPDLMLFITLDLDEHARERAVLLARHGVDVIRLRATEDGRGYGACAEQFITRLARDIHEALVDAGVREQLTILADGGLAQAEHIAKIVACGADGVCLNRVLAVAMECRLCHDGAKRKSCPVAFDQITREWGAQRIVNLIGSWHTQLIEVLGAMGIREVRRLRGELGRVMFFEDLERESFEPVFGKRIRSFEESLRHMRAAVPNPADIGAAYAPAASEPEDGVAICGTRFRNHLAPFLVVRTSDCVACGRCAEVCAHEVHRKGGSRMLKPRSWLCPGPSVCTACVEQCPTGALRLAPDPSWKTFGDHRWTPELLLSTWLQAETGYPPMQALNDKSGQSGGGFDCISIEFPEHKGRVTAPDPEVDLRLALNRRNDGRPERVLGIPFYGGGMSYGSINMMTMRARARAYRTYDSLTCTGEGGYPDGLCEFSDNVIVQVATGLFGVSEETVKRAPVVEFKYAQGAKPGLGGHLLGDKVTPEVAKIRETVQGNALFSPFPFHSVYSVEDHRKHVDWITAMNPEALISVKVSTASDVDMVAVGSYFAGAHIIHLDGSYGGTGAAPDIAKKNIAMPIEYAIPKVHRFLKNEGIRDEITLICSGGIRSPYDVAKAIALGADGVVIGTAELVALECIRCGACERGRGCPRGIATTDPELAVIYTEEWATQRLVNLFHAWRLQLAELLNRLGLPGIRDLVGRSDLLRHCDYDNQHAGEMRI